MTGFGRGVAEREGARATVDVRTVNHRYLDIKIRGVPVAPALEDAVATKVRATVERGSVAISIHVTRTDAPGGTRIDPHAAAKAHVALAELARHLGMAGPDLALILAQPGVVVSDGERADDDPAVLAALDAALAQLMAMRDDEGSALTTELAARVDELAAARASIAQLAATVPQQVQRRLHDRLRRLLEDHEDVDPSRLAQEVAVLADRADVTEELVRLASHLEQARSLVAPGSRAVGRRLDFLVQEIGRELNTIGSKSTTGEISSVVVEAKSVLEKVREQVQNVE
jgi:uncharacterized protein (TIGR00255 family)